MTKTTQLLVLINLLVACTSAPSGKRTGLSSTSYSNMNKEEKQSFEISHPESYWKEKLTPEQYYVIRQKGTERPFTGKFEDHFEPGIYTCAACGNELFSSETKYHSGCGWPSFYDALDKSKIYEQIDYSHGMVRMEIMCAKCGGHLGHVFNDGPADKTGLRYCVNSLSLDFKKDTANKK